MNPLEVLRDYIRREHAAAKLELVGPLRKDGAWSLDIDLADKKLAVEWSEETGFGISNIDTDGYGERPDETYGTLKEIKQRVSRLLTSAERTSPPFGILLSRLREHRKVTQQELAQRLGIKQATVSGIEHREDVQVSTLWRAVGALGGTLEVYAVFLDARYRLDVGTHEQASCSTRLPTKPARTEGASEVRSLDYRATFVGLTEAGHLQRATELADGICSRHSVIEFI